MSKCRQFTKFGLSFFVGCVLIAMAVVRADVNPSQGNTTAGSFDKLHPALLSLLDEATVPVRAWVFFADKGIAPGSEFQAALDRVATTYNPRAIQRRILRGRAAHGRHSLFDEHDLPVVQAYIDAVTETGARLRVTSRWINAISVEATGDQLEQVAAFPFVTKLQPVARARRPEILNQREIGDGPFSGQDQQGASPRSIDYGVATAQLNQVNLIALHDAGFTGEGVIVGILDTGFHRSHEAFNHPSHPLTVIAEYDFVNNDGNTDIELGDAYDQANHGTMILGVLGGYMPGELVGGAYDASFVLAKTEDTTDEYPAEEDNYVAGLEFIEANGADMVTSSLGYIDWYTQADLDGLTAVTTIAVNIATSNGLHLCNAAGNEYHDSNPATSSLIAPADAFQVITCGAVDSGGSIAYFSSDGPTADGRVKPEVLARGVSTHTVSPSNDTTYTTADGTSLSTPVVACTVACLLQAKPWWSVDAMREHLFETADYYVSHETYDPLYVYGYGVVDAMGAFSSEPLTIMLPNGAPWRVDPGEPTVIAVQIEAGSETVTEGSETLHYRFDAGTYSTSLLTPLGGELYEALLPAAGCDDAPQFYFSADGDGGSAVTDPPTAPTDVYSAVVATLTTILEDDFETDQGWTVENTSLTSGAWERGVPVGDGERGDPTVDFDGSGQCYLTGNAAGDSDVDGGPTRLLSPTIDVTGVSDPLLRYARWFANDDHDIDRLDVEISDDDGASWVLLESVASVEDVSPEWIEMEFHVADYVDLTSQIKARFSVTDNPNNSKTEVAIDAVKVYDLACSSSQPGDFDGDGDVDLDDLAVFIDVLIDADTNPDHRAIADVDGSDTPDGDDIQLYVGLLVGE